jgi:hypothetical protein
MGKILKWIFKKWDAGTDWIAGAKDSDRWPALVRIGTGGLLLLG